ncbi:MAG: hypothetical protein RMY29_020410 [Nostoc sp. CreGUA01]
MSLIIPRVSHPAGSRKFRRKTKAPCPMPHTPCPMPHTPCLIY